MRGLSLVAASEGHSSYIFNNNLGFPNENSAFTLKWELRLSVREGGRRVIAGFGRRVLCVEYFLRGTGNWPRAKTSSQLEFEPLAV